ncbi:LamG domain-containing protein [Streptomyces yaizuensis]|uniref:Laminin G domain-containing protein n=1 Tax=Streptomyces yaizuensis TaxID=2989713 RepID=A0ABQ5NXM3_9ACTN|nr:LamG domain-containing protein [Streptomyces sp. YSPA8]GLF95112.1 laminin G domain-containing protein [Streptomyces sp. YSPA8]
MTTADQSLVKIYSDRVYTHTTMVRHQGTVLAFAIDDARRIVYSVLDLSTFDEEKGELDAAYWSENPVALPFPTEVVKVGYAVAGATVMPVVKKDSQAEATAVEVLEPEETDTFLSSTARLTAPGAPFQVLSDGSHVVVLRQAIGRDGTDAVFTLKEGSGSTGDRSRVDVQTAGATPVAVPVVDGTLLCDRFLLVGGELKPVSEVRFKRSRHKTLPASEKDSLGAFDMDGRPFFEPTQELDLIRNLTGGRFTAVLVPTAVQGQQRWQFFAHNSATGRIDAFSIEQDPDGLFNTQGSRYWTSPDPAYRGSVYERQPGTCPFTGKALIPLVPDARHAETALRLNGTTDGVALGKAPKLAFGGRSYAVEAWVKPDVVDGRRVVVGRTASGSDGWELGFTTGGKLALRHGGKQVVSAQALTAGVYTHIAASFDGTRATLYVNGGFSMTDDLPWAAESTADLRIGSAAGTGFFAGDIDEVRIWNRPRAQAEIAGEMAYRLIGNEPGLLAYYRLDEGSGTTAYDLTDTAAHGTLAGGPVWVTSLAPVGDHPGVRRDSFTVAGRDIVSGLSSTLYYQQEDIASGYREEARPVRRQARVLLACATRPAGEAAAQAHLASVDFGVGIDGRLADIPDVITLAELGQAQEQSIDKVREQEALIVRLEGQARTIQQAIDPLNTELNQVLAEATAARNRPNDALAWIYQLRWTLFTGSVMDSEGVWWVTPLPGVAGRYGNPAVAVLRIGATPQILEMPNSIYAVDLKDCAFTDPVPEARRWYIDGSFPGSFRLQSAVNSEWLLAPMSNGAVRNTDRARSALIAGTQKGQAPNPQLDSATARGRVILSQLMALTRDLDAKKSEIQLAQEELSRLTGGLLGSGELGLPLPRISVDASGLSCAGALLKFAGTDTAPFLTDGAAGRVALYFRGTNGQFFAAYLDTGTQRGSQQLSGGGQTVLLTARDPGVDLSTGSTRITVADHTVNGSVVAQLCDLTITRGTESETFPGLPRAARELAAVVNGVPEDSVRVGAVKSVQGGTVTLATGTPVALPAAGYLRIGGVCHRVAGAVDPGAAAVTVTPAPPAGAAGADVFLVRYDSSLATSSRPGVSLARGSRWITVGASAGDLPVPNGTAVAGTPGYGSRWRGDSPGRSFAFDGTAQRLTLPDAKLDQVTTPAGDLSVEAWVSPGRFSGTRARLLHLNRGQTRAALALVPGDPLPGGMLIDGADDDVVLRSVDPVQTDFTIECWLKRTTGRTVVDTIAASRYTGLSMGFTPDGKFRFAVGADASAQTLTTTASYPDGDWHHWAVTFNRTTLAQVIYRDGAEVARRTATGLPTGQDFLIVGRTDDGQYSRYSGALAEFRIWSVARTGTDIAADRFRRATAGEPGLAGAWVYDRNRPGTTSDNGQLRFVDISGQNRHGEVWGNTPAQIGSALVAYRVQAAVGDKARVSRDAWPPGQWDHLAAVYEQSWALRFEGAAWAETPDADQLDITGDLTIEVFVSIDSTATRQGLLSKGRLADGADGSVPYQLSLLPGGKLEFAFEEPGPVVRRFQTATAISAGFHRIGVVRKAGSTTQEVKGKKSFPITDASGNTTNQEFDVVERVDVAEWQDIRVVVDGTELALDTSTPLLGVTLPERGRYTGPGPRGNSGALEIGRTRDGDTVYGLTGTVGEVRIWGKARENNQLGTPLEPRDEGLVARWTFEENTGNTTADPAGGYDLRLRGARWATDPDPRASAFTLYRNGSPVPADTPATNPLGDWGSGQLTLGAWKDSAGTFGDFYNGVLEEVRLWRTARAPEQILDSLFTRIKGDKQDLLGYWPFDAASTTATTEAVADQSLRGNHLDPGTDTTRPAIVLSTAPVSTDTAAVRSALAGVRTFFQERISTPPAAAEYADLQYTPDGQATGVLKRAYTHITDGAWRLITGYKVGDLVTEWVSQVQFDPQLIGYIEGAPPVPSENLTGKSDPSGASSVTFKEADKVTSLLGSAGTGRFDMSFKAAVKAQAKWGAMSVIAPLGLGVSNPIVSIEVKGSVTNATDYASTWTNETTVSQATTIDRNTTAALSGYWESPTGIRNTVVGKRYLPENKGYALVQSETADVYALRLAHTGDLVAYRMVPNPDIPKDWNIISFPINPQYTKQGTLDGAIGLTEQGGKILDEAYPTAAQYGEYSYFKPREAYALKRRILRERQELENFYSGVSTGVGDPDPTAEQAAKILKNFTGITPAAPDAKPDTESAGAFANRNIANAYVWTADGGFFSETTGTIDVVNETVSGSYSWTNKVTASLEINILISGAGVGYQMDATFGGGYSQTRRRSQETSRGHSLDVICKPNRDLQKYKADGTPEYVNDKPVLVPGKVDAYRFMTFYLAQDTTHFDDFYNKVIDPTWLAGSNDANATALRQARQSDRKPPCWRILHRVTFLSRVLPPVTSNTPPSLAKDMRTIDIPSNYELIRRLDPYVSTAATTLPNLTAATRTALATHLPSLTPHTQEIAQFLAAYYGVTD